MGNNDSFATQLRCLVDSRYRRAYRSLRHLPKVPYRYVIDAGASRGSFADAFLELQSPERIVLVEAIPDLAEKLVKQFQGRSGVSVVSSALSDKVGEATFEVNQFDYSSSLLKIDPRNSQWFGRDLAVSRKITVPTVSLPELMDREKLPHVDLLKMDLQGAERFVIAGAEPVLSKVNVIYSEVLFERLYEGCWLFRDMEDYLVARGFKLCSLSNIVHAVDGDILQANATFRRVK